MNLTDAAEILLTHARSRLVRKFFATPHDGSLGPLSEAVDLIEDLFVNHGEDFEDLTTQNPGIGAASPSALRGFESDPLNLAMVRCYLLAVGDLSESPNASSLEATHQVIAFWLRHGPDICAAMHVIPVDLKM